MMPLQKVSAITAKAAGALYLPAILGQGAVVLTNVGEIVGGEPVGIRTRDPMIKSHVLYQLSYGLPRQGA